MALYVVAVKRERRADIPPDWHDTLGDTPGVEVTGSSEARRVIVLVTGNGLDELRARVGAYCHIEPLISHDTSAP